jgi:three-Cys-motif partner protein
MIVNGVNFLRRLVKCWLRQNDMMEAAYVGREQTQAKHFILRRYLQTLTYKLLGGGWTVLTYVDGFSGPWQSKTDDFSDTSFMIAINVLKDAHQKFRTKGIPKEIRCFFVEDDHEAYIKLKAAVMAHHEPWNGFHVETFPGRFEDAVSKIRSFVGKSFALVFIDPTGWSGFPYVKIAPLLKYQHVEVLINFMYDHVNRFIASSDPTIVASFDPILGANWKDRLDPNLTLGGAAEKLFRDELRNAGGFRYVLSTSIEKATANRPHFSIAYGTRSVSGLKSFRQVEYDALRGHAMRRAEARLKKDQERTGQSSLFDLADLPIRDSIDQIVSENKTRASAWIEQFIEDRGRPFSEVCALALEQFMLRETDVKDVCVLLANNGVIAAPWKPNQRKPHDLHLIELTGN